MELGSHHGHDGRRIWALWLAASLVTKLQAASVA
jgi:hypothetical protein